MLKNRGFIFAIVLVLVITMFAGCSSGNNSSSLPASESTEPIGGGASSEPESEAPSEKSTVRVGAIKGPSSLGMLGVMENNEQQIALNSYEFTLAGSPQDIQAKLINGELDIAAIPTNLASVLYNKTNQGISAVAVGTLGVLYVLSKEDAITSFKDLEGKTIYASGQGSTPEYVLDYLIDKNGLSGKISVEYKAEHAELASLIASGNADIAMLPQPFVTTVTSKDDSVKIVMDLNEEWRSATDTELAMTCIVVRNEFLSENKDAVDKFIEEYKASTEFVNANVDEAAELSGKFEIIPAEVAQKAIPYCSIICIAGNDMKTSVNPLLEVLMGANPQSVGGQVPDDAFYYKG